MRWNCLRFVCLINDILLIAQCQQELIQVAQEFLQLLVLLEFVIKWKTFPGLQKDPPAKNSVSAGSSKGDREDNSSHTIIRLAEV